MTAPPSTLRLAIANKTESLEPGMDAVEQWLMAWAVDPAQRGEVMLIVDEIASNIIKSAWPGGGTHDFRIELFIDAQLAALHLNLIATDDGVAFDPTQVAAPSLELDLDEREPGGLGLFLVGQMADMMQYSRVEGQNRLHVVKKLHRG